VALGGKVDNKGLLQTAKQIRLSQPDLSPLAALDIILVHSGKTLLELQRQAFSHYADAVNCINQRLGSGLEYVAFDNLHLISHESPPLFEE